MEYLDTISGYSRRHALVPAVAALSIAINSFPLRTYEGLDLWFGGLFPCIAILYINPLQGVLAAAIGYAFSLLLWGHPFGMLGSAILALIASYANKNGSRKLLFDLLLGLSLVVPLIALIVHRYGGPTNAVALSLILKPPVNSILNLSFALLLVETFGARRWLPRAGSVKPYPLRASLLAGFLAVSMTPLVLVFLFQGRHFEKGLLHEQESKLKDTAATVSDALNEHINRHFDAVITAASAIEEGRHADRDTLARILEAWHRRFPGFLTMIVTDADGRIIAAHPRISAAGSDYLKTTHVVSDRSYFREPKATGKPHISHVFRGRGFGTDPIVALSAPYRTRSAFGGVVEGSLDLAGLRSSLMSLASAREAELIVLDQTKVIAATSGTDHTHLDDLSGSPILRQIQAQEDSQQPFALILQGKEFLAASAPSMTTGWIACVLYPKSILIATLNRYFTETTLLLIVIMVLSVIAANFLARQVTRPLDGLMRQVRRLRDQPANFRPVACESGPEEIEILLHDFQEMTARLQFSYSGLQTSIQERDALNIRLTNLLSELEERVRVRTSEFESAKLRAEEANRTKSAFLANMSHEVRTPLNGVIGMLTMILDHPLPAEQKERAAIALDSAESLLSVLNDVLDLSKIEAGHLNIERVAFRMDQLIETALLPHRTTVESKGLAFHLTVDPKCRRSFFGDPARLRQVLANLTGNAVKFTRHGAISIHVQGLEIDQRSCAVHLQIRDTGIGIPKSAQLRLFSPFQQADSTTTRRFGGTGLGLAICRELIQRMGGVIGFESTEGAGSTFWFRVVLDLAPDAVPEPLPSSRPAEAACRRGQVLIVEDNTVNQLVAQRLVEKAGYSVTVVDSGRRALDTLSHSSFDAILMDCQMPEMDGYQTTAEIRRIESTRHTPIIAMTAHAMSGDRERCLAAGMDDYITKPVRESELHELLHRWTAVAAS